MAIDFVQSNSNNGNDVASVAVAFTSANTAANTIVVCAGAWSGGTVGSLSVTDTQGNTYTLIQTDNSDYANQSTVSVWYAANIKAGANTVTVSGATGSAIDVIVAEYSGPATSGPLSASSVAVAVGSTVSAAAVTPTSGNEAFLLYGYDQTNAGDSFAFSSLPSAAFTQRQSTSNVGGESSALTDSIGTFTEALTPTVSITPSSHALYIVAILLSDESSGSGGADQVELELLGAWTVESATQTVQSGYVGTGPQTYALTGTLPTGLTFDNSTGQITGTATQAGAFTFTITKTDANGKTSQYAFTVSIASADVPVDTSVCAAILYGVGAA
ncbi:MAG TPA: Ig domain-containing protein [Acidobacteriaceae bacterium]|nr:Ig domain-containing protein [Acidobacteriaceae bacterium]